MKVVLITGSTRGIGYGLADSFLALGCAVVINGRTRAAVDVSVATLSARYSPERVFGFPCDVTDCDQVQALWEAAQARYKRVDVWINNAGISAPQFDFWENSAERIEAVVRINLIGAMYGARVALRAMLDQGFGALYNMEGMGSDGRRVDGLTLYGVTKSGLRYLTDGLAAEVKGTPVLVGALRPGMVVTEMVTGQYEDRPEDWERAKRIFNIIADRVETVTPWLAQRVLANQKNGTRISWLSRGKLTFRFLTASFSKRNIFD